MDAKAPTTLPFLLCLEVPCLSCHLPFSTINKNYWRICFFLDRSHRQTSWCSVLRQMFHKKENKNQPPPKLPWIGSWARIFEESLSYNTSESVPPLTRHWRFHFIHQSARPHLPAPHSWETRKLPSKFLTSLFNPCLPTFLSS